MNVLLTGTKLIEVPGKSRLDIQSEVDFPVVLVDEETGEEQETIAVTKAGKLKVKIEDDIILACKCPDGFHWSYDIIKRTEENDGVPFAVIEENRQPMSLETKLRYMIAQMALEKFGRDSEEVETLEDALDFDIDDYDDPMSQYEVREMVPEPLNQEADTTQVTDPPPAEPAPAPQPPAAEPSA